MRKWIIFIGCAALFLQCNGTSSQQDESEGSEPILIKSSGHSIISDTLKPDKLPVFNAIVNEVVEKEMRQYLDGEFDEFTIYQRDENSFEIWSDFMWGRCCTEADLQYAELLSFEITSTIMGKDYPFENATDDFFKTAYAFSINEAPEITLSLKKESGYFGEEKKKYWPGNLLKDTDTIVSNFEFTIVNGYVKSEETYKNNARIKEMEIRVNGELYGIVELLDSPRPQRVVLDFPFFKMDQISLIPFSYYPGDKYEDVCISAIQQNLGGIAHPSINDTFIMSELRD